MRLAAFGLEGIARHVVQLPQHLLNDGQRDGAAGGVVPFLYGFPDGEQRDSAISLPLWGHTSASRRQIARKRERAAPTLSAPLFR